MRNYDLNIAGYIIRFVSAGNGPDLKFSERFHGYVGTGQEPVVTIVVHSGGFTIPPAAKKVFDALYVEEISGIQTRKHDRFWRIYRDKDKLLIETFFPFASGEKRALLKLSLRERSWEMWIPDEEINADPMEYPLDGLILYYLTVMHGDIFIHASGINKAGKGYLFSGISGKGKSTMADLWSKAGATVIHDDRLIIRNDGNNYVMHNTPVYDNDYPRNSPLHKVFIIDHGTENQLTPVSGASAVSLVTSNCIQHNWDATIINRLLDTVSSMCNTVPVAELMFRPDRKITDFILENEHR